MGWRQGGAPPAGAVDAGGRARSRAGAGAGAWCRRGWGTVETAAAEPSETDRAAAVAEVEARGPTGDGSSIHRLKRQAATPYSHAAPHDDGTTDMLSHGRWGPKRSCVSVPHGSGSILPGVRWDYDKCTLSTTPLAVRGKWSARSACQWEHDNVARRGPRGSVRASMACGARGVVLIQRCSSVRRPPPPLPLGQWCGPARQRDVS